VAPESKVMGSPVSCRAWSAVMARSRVAWARRRAASVRWWLLSARIDGVLWSGQLGIVGVRCAVLFELADDSVEFSEYHYVGLDHAELTVVLGDGR